MASPPRATRLAVLISGNGTNLQALIDASARSRAASTTNTTTAESMPDFPHPTQIAHVVSNRPAAYGLTRCALATPSIPSSTHLLPAYKRRFTPDAAGVALARAAYDADLATLVLSHAPPPDIIVCAGWMHILSSAFLAPVAAAGVPIINLHPALPGLFDGANAIQRAWEAGERGEVDETGVMVHYVVEAVDRGEVVCVRRVGIVRGEGVEALEARVRGVERGLLVEGVGVVTRRVWEGTADGETLMGV